MKTSEKRKCVKTMVPLLKQAQLDRWPTAHLHHPALPPTTAVGALGHCYPTQQGRGRLYYSLEEQMRKQMC